MILALIYNASQMLGCQEFLSLDVAVEKFSSFFQRLRFIDVILSAMELKYNT